ncbi:MAG: hypothetical protein I8H91_02040 [Burkholderiales bacterium]|nr:hypothetical protein [Burkholderiales bacterium]
MSKQIDSTAAQRKAQLCAMGERIDRRNFVKKAVFMGVGLQLILAGCGSGSEEYSPSIAEGSIKGGALDGAALAITTLPSGNDAKSPLLGRLTLGGITTGLTFTGDGQIAQALELIDQTADTNRYRITLLSPDDQVMTAEAAVTQLLDKYHIIVNANGSQIAFDIPQSVVNARVAESASSEIRPSPLGGVLIFALVVLIICVAALLYLAGQIALCHYAGGIASFTTSTVLIFGTPWTKISFECRRPTGATQ